MAVFRGTDPAVLENPEIQAFVYRALAKNRLVCRQELPGVHRSSAPDTVR
jgi:hypothetical protein